MLFNSLEFGLFLPIVFCLYWLVTKGDIRRQNWILLLASYFFYGWWDWRFLSLIAISSIVDYFVGLYMGREENPAMRKRLLWVSIGVNLGFLGFFKYYNFFADSFADAFSFLGHSFSPTSLHVVLPVGISFYTFQTMSYTIDVYRRQTPATKDALSFFAYVAFFPQLVAGPIERAKTFLPQFARLHSFKYERIRTGFQLILWGLFKKMVIADNCAYWGDLIFADPSPYSSLVLALGVVLFAFQIYGDFSGYSDIAIGTGRLLGFELRKNFGYPYFSRDLAEFWRRWHISLSTWFRDYLYIPLGGSRVTKLNQVRNVLVIFLVSGLWHGANWTFVAWGLMHALLFLPLILSGKNRKHLNPPAPGRLFPTIGVSLQIFLTFVYVGLAWVLFRAANLMEAMNYYQGLLQFTASGVKIQHLFPLVGIGFLLFVEWFSRDRDIPIFFQARNTTVRWLTYWGLALAILVFSPAEPSVFIYFQF